MKVRVDKWLHVARVFKTRSRAAEACTSGHVTVNGSKAKAHRLVATGDRVEVQFGEWQRILVVREVRDKPLPRAEAALLYQDLSPPRPVRDPLDQLLRQPPLQREKGKGRPTKRERRQIERLKGF